jgi:hypothetical protein
MHYVLALWLSTVPALRQLPVRSAGVQESVISEIAVNETAIGAARMHYLYASTVPC